jgi:AraC-like DNA-binding protein
VGKDEDLQPPTLIPAVTPSRTNPPRIPRVTADRPKVVPLVAHPSTPSPGEKEGDSTLILVPGACGSASLASALYIPDAVTATAEPQNIQALKLRLHSRRLSAAAARLSEFSWSQRRFDQLLREPIRLQGGSGETSRYLEQLLGLACLVDQWDELQAIDARRLGLEEVFDRLVVLSLWGGKILGISSRRDAGAAEKAVIIEELLQWIRANCQRPISLAELERRSGYSQRSLRNAFHERFGCAPNEWIRRERMESARLRLLDARPGETVSSIAAEHGYSHVSQFSRDFRGVFGLQPSQVMRRGRRPID